MDLEYPVFPGSRFSPLSRVKFKGQPTPALPELPLAHSPPSTIDIDQTLLSSAAARDYQRHAISTSNRHCRSHSTPVVHKEGTTHHLSYRRTRETPRQHTSHIPGPTKTKTFLPTNEWSTPIIFTHPPKVHE
ncbi:LOW QUALITY PROTEIN: hypothetical protein ACHAXN_003313 [Cyclotella atomus]